MCPVINGWWPSWFDRHTRTRTRHRNFSVPKNEGMKWESERELYKLAWGLPRTREGWQRLGLKLRLGAGWGRYQQRPTGNGSAPNKALLKFFNSLDIFAVRLSFAFRSPCRCLRYRQRKTLSNSASCEMQDTPPPTLHHLPPTTQAPSTFSFSSRNQQPRSQCSQVYCQLAESWLHFVEEKAFPTVPTVPTFRGTH